MVWIVTFQLLYTAGLHQVMMSIGCVSLQAALRLFVIGAFRSLLWLLMIGGFRSSLFWLDDVPWRVHCVIDQQLCCLIEGIHKSGISILLSQLILLGWRLMWMASFTLWLSQCRSLHYIFLPDSQSLWIQKHSPPHYQIPLDLPQSWQCDMVVCQKPSVAGHHSLFNNTRRDDQTPDDLLYCNWSTFSLTSFSLPHLDHNDAVSLCLL